MDRLYKRLLNAQLAVFHRHYAALGFRLAVRRMDAVGRRWRDWMWRNS
jgi:hypothetical protein